MLDQRTAPLDLGAVYEPKLGAHIPALDALRGLAILMVTAYRFNLGPDDSSPLGHAFSRLMHLGGSGVELFFVLSGFLITGILYDARGTSHYFRNFYVRRVLRIFPLYYGVLLLAIVLLPLLTDASVYPMAEEKQPWLWLYGANIYLSLENSWIALGWFGHFWSLAVEEHFYLLWPLVIFWLPRRSAMAACVVCAAIAVASRIAFSVQGDFPVAVEALTPCQLDSLAVGAFLALAARGPGGCRALLRPAAVVGGIATVLFIACNFWFYNALDLTLTARRSVDLTLYPLIYGGLLILVVTARPWTLFGRGCNSPVLCFFGKYSYGLYVFQNLLLPVAGYWFTPEDTAAWTDSPLLGRLLYMGLMGGITLGVSLLSWNLFEKHFLKLKRAFEPRKPAEIATPLPGSAALAT